jgi:hypothetical protein
MATKLSTPDKRMLQLVEVLKDKGTIRYKQEFVDAIDMPKQNLRQVRLGVQHFTALHIMKACKAYNINANWIMGHSPETFNQKATLRFISDGNTVNKKHNSKTKKTGK